MFACFAASVKPVDQLCELGISMKIEPAGRRQESLAWLHLRPGQRKSEAGAAFANVRLAYDDK